MAPMQAIVKIGSSQYRVSVGQKLLVDRPTVEGVLMILDDKNISVGKPFVDGAVVKLKVLGQVKGKKIRTATYKAKSRERKVRGFRAQYSEVLVEDISFGEKKTVPAEKKPVVKKAVKAKS